MSSDPRFPSPPIADAAGGHAPEVVLLSNGRYHLMLTAAGAGYSKWKDMALTRWRDDAVCDDRGSFCYLRDASSGALWSATTQPTLQRPDWQEVAFGPERAVFRRRDHDIVAVTEIAVAPDDDVEVRRTRLTNGGPARRVIDVTSYLEVVLSAAAADAAHPAFNKMFVGTESLAGYRAILCSRRPQAPAAPAPVMFHLIVPHQPGAGAVSCETDRLRFIGRGRTTARPRATDDGAALSGSVGPVLDPVAALRCRVALAPGQSAAFDLVTGVAATRAACIALVGRYHERAAADRVLAAAAARAMARAAAADAPDRRLYARMAACVLYTNPTLRAGPEALSRNVRGQCALWAYGISGDLPIVLLYLADPANLVLARQWLQAQGTWRAQGLSVDAVIVNAAQGGQAAALRQQLTQLIAAIGASGRVDQPGGVFVREAAQIAQEDDILLRTAARIVLRDGEGTLQQQLDRRLAAPPSPSRRPSASPAWPGAHRHQLIPDGAGNAGEGAQAEDTPAAPLLFENGVGGFAPNGREYIVTLRPGQTTPAPWINVLANPSFGTLVSESGSANTWSGNAQQFRLTPWSNDPVTDPNTEAFYLRDEDSGRFWSATRLPSPGTGPYVARHGFGYSVFEHGEDGIGSALRLFVAIDAPVKYAWLTLRNDAARPRRLSVTGYVEWVLGDEREKTRPFVGTERDGESGAVFARNPYHADVPRAIAFFGADAAVGVPAAATACGDRAAFLGRHGSLRAPAAMFDAALSGALGAGLDPCAALRLPVELAAGQSVDLVFRLGAAGDAAQARDLLRGSASVASARAALAKVKRFWRRTLGAVQVRTPDRAFDLMVNGWLVYQVLSCRLWARNAFYQSSGAFGFRDQLQDVMALVHSAPDLVRAHLLVSAQRQFPEGDVQHWWHPPSGRGVRTHCSDDYLWLPLALCRYVDCTGDVGVLDEPVRFIEGAAPAPDAESRYELPTTSARSASLYQHGVRAIERGLRFGAHGLPLMGGGDWNDGMNLVGAQGRGESVWLGWFLYAVLTQFAGLARRRADAAFARRCDAEAERLRAAIEASGWDGAWYRRAWFDDGSPLGSAGNAECRIDSIAQSWAVLSGAAQPGRARAAMDALERHLVRPDAALVQLLDPPFERSVPHPGYIQGYPRGVRENGGQYTHAAVWAAMAFAALGDHRRAWQLMSMLNPLGHADSPAALARYKTEPYVLASDVYAFAPHTGRGGWTWYTGAAGWMARLALESLLGLTREHGRLRIAPCVPADWRGFSLRYRYRATRYDIAVLLDDGPPGTVRVSVDGADQPDPSVALVDDGRAHRVRWRLARPA